YLYFPTKDDLHRAALEGSLERLAAEVERAAEADAPAEALLRHIVLSILRFFWRRHHLLTLVQRYERRPTRPPTERRRPAPEAPAGEARPEAVTITVASVATRPVERTVSVVGTLAANAQADLASEVEGQVVVVDADLGDRVRGDQVLARVRGDVTEARLREAE